jgi:hypothetical protein
MKEGFRSAARLYLTTWMSVEMQTNEKEKEAKAEHEYEHEEEDYEAT